MRTSALHLIQMTLLALLTGIAAGCGRPASNAVTSDGLGNKTWTITAARHPSVPAIEESEIKGHLEGAAGRWRIDDDGADGEQDVAVPIYFEYEGPCKTFPNAFLNADLTANYNNIPNKETLDKLMESKQIDAWVLFVTDTWTHGGYGYIGQARVVLTAALSARDVWYAHELGHNAGNRDRENCPNSSDPDVYLKRVGDLDFKKYVPIMVSIPPANDVFNVIPALARPAERDKMITWIYTKPGPTSLKPES